MRELDELLLGYLNDRYEAAPDTEKQAFHSLLALSDPELIGYLLQKEQPTAEIAGVIKYILDRTQA
jgi:succinate dehydrogenase flavin-adding protein (antitoxin of CptAB toxin-antitoxin module)